MRTLENDFPPADFKKVLTLVNQAFLRSQSSFRHEYEMLMAELHLLACGNETDKSRENQFPGWTLLDIQELLAQHGDFIKVNAKPSAQLEDLVVATAEEVASITGNLKRGL